MNPELTIAHLSDLHFTSEMTWPPSPDDEAKLWAMRFRALADDVAEQMPDLVVVTGDLADNHLWELQYEGLAKSWDIALAFLEGLCKRVFGSEPESDWKKRLFVIPGNHDVKVLGNISPAKLTQITNSKKFKLARWFLSSAARAYMKRKDIGLSDRDLEALFDSELKTVLETSPVDVEAFARKFGAYTTSRRIDALRMYVFCVNSNIATDSVVTFAQGAVSASEARQFRETAKKWQVEDTSYKDWHKIALVHHHPMPIPLAEGRSGVTEADQFHLMRNAGTFLNLCIDNKIDFVLHGHKHARSCSTVSIPRRDGRDHSVVVIGAGSGQVPFDNTCSYNLLRQNADRSWDLIVRERVDRDEGPSDYKEEEVLRIMSPDQYRHRMWASSPHEIGVRRLDMVASVNINGDLSMAFTAHGVFPLKATELQEYNIVFSAESKRTMLDNISFPDEDKNPYALRGKIPLTKPATAKNPRDIEYSFTAVGMVTQSKEYCRIYKNDTSENVSVGIAKRYDSMTMEVDFPDEFLPKNPRVQVVDFTGVDAAKIDISVSRMVEEGIARLDTAETAYCRDQLRVWWRNSRLSFHVDRPLPNRYYRVVWDLPETEYATIPAAKSGPNRRGLTEASIKELRRILLTPHASNEQEIVRNFLRGVGEWCIQQAQKPDCSFRIDLATLTDTQTLKVVALAAHEKGGWGSGLLNIACDLGVTSRGRAFLERRPILYAPGDAQNARNPSRHELEPDTKHQVAIPLVWPPALPYYPRIGVMTISSDTFACPLFDWLNLPETLEASSSLELTFHETHRRLSDLAKALQCPLPEFPDVSSV
jgi:3',5'-cyclic AMP phosphodiesterase CpdA